MAKGSFECPKCDRTFSMAAHLARHMNTIHRAKAGRIPPKKKVAKAKTRAGRTKGTGIRQAGRPKQDAARSRWPLVEGSARLLSEIQTYHDELIAQRSSLDAQIDGIASTIETLGAVAPARPMRKGAKRDRSAAAGSRAGSLKDYISRVLRQRSKPMSPRNISAAVMKVGFKTKAKDITKAVSNTLPQMKNVKKVGFGMYQLT